MDKCNLDILISRVVDQEATVADWNSLESRAAGEPAVWRDLGAALRLNQELIGEVRTATDVAERVTLDEGAFSELRSVQATMSIAGRVRKLGAWGGWIAAGLLVLVMNRAGPIAGNDPVGNQAGLSLAPADYLSNYLSSGKREGSVVGEMPRKLLLDTTPAEDGGTYVLYVRQIVERMKVDDLYRISVDGLGNPTPVKLPAEIVTPVRAKPAM